VRPCRAKTPTIGTHAGTHLDAPYHHNSVIHGRPAPTIDELPLEWFLGPGVVVDAQEKGDGEAVTAPPTTGFTVACFPLTIKGASAGLSRVVAILGA
jgi:kynurenine formamidase